MKVVLQEKFRTQRYIRYRVEISKDNVKTITFVDVPVHAGSKRFFEELLRALGVSEIEYATKENA